MGMLRKSGLAGLLSMMMLAPVHAGQSAPPTYSFTALGAGAAHAINNAGQIVGETGTDQAVLWVNGTATVLGSDADATAINAGGTIVGYDTHHHDRQAMDWDGSDPSQLNTGKNKSSVATGINDNGAEVGYEYRDGQRDRSHAVIWDDGQMIRLGSLNGWRYSRATGINDNGQAVGYLYGGDRDGRRRAVIWNGSSATLLGSLGRDTSSEATAINDNGQAVGYSETDDGTRSAVIWNGTKPTMLSGLGGGDSMALGINDAGVVVGYSYLSCDATQQAVLWENGKLINLNSELSSAEIKAGWVLEEATGINDNGTIVGIADNTKTGKQDAFALNVIAAVPEPHSFVMLLMGLGWIAATTRRRHRAY